MSDSDPITRLNAALEGRYRIERELGEGGMATVYLADDLKHERKVALKVLKPELAAVVGAERFLAEIKTTAKLSHPHVLPLFDSGEADGFLFYVMPHVEGESLRDRLDREHQLPVDDAVQIAKNVAEALDYAHRKGVIHRDIKPANILLLDGKPVISDFGIALAVGAAGGGRLTETGLSLGTPHYMSPEQATGDQSVGPATDIYATGCVLYEMLVGEPPYTGSTAQAILGKIIAGELATTTKQRASVPANVDAAISKALEKLPADRFMAAQDFANAMADPAFRHGEVVATEAGVSGSPWNRVALTFVGTTVLLALAFVWAFFRPEAHAIVRSTLVLPEGQQLARNLGVNLALSADGSRVVYAGVQQLWLRPLDQLYPQAIPGTDGAMSPVLSPDGTSVAFVVGGRLFTVPLTGGPPNPVASGVWASGIDWGSDGMLYFATLGGAIHRVPPSGGEAEQLTTNAPGTRHAYVDVLPRNRGLLFTVQAGATWEISAMGFDDGEIRSLFAGSMARYASSGHIVYTSADGMLWYASFDVARLEAGPSVPLTEGVDQTGGDGPPFALSETGALVYLPRAGLDDLVPVWVDRDGTAQEIESGWSFRGSRNFSSLTLSPDETRLAISFYSAGTYDLWVKQLPTGPVERLTSEGAVNRRAIWSADGRSITFTSNRAGQFDLWTMRADGSSLASRVLDRERSIYEAVYSGDEQWLVFREGSRGGGGDIYGIGPTQDADARPLVVTEFHEEQVALSPNGRWLAYVSNRTGQKEVYVRPFPDVSSSRQQASTDGGSEPLWAHSGEELFYRNGADELVAAEVTADSLFAVRRRDVLFSLAEYLPGTGWHQYDVAQDDQKFLMLRVERIAAGNNLVLIQDFVEDLRRPIGN